jgi:hypothetical protein
VFTKAWYDGGVLADQMTRRFFCAAIYIAGKELGMIPERQCGRKPRCWSRQD